MKKLNLWFLFLLVAFAVSPIYAQSLYPNALPGWFPTVHLGNVLGTTYQCIHADSTGLLTGTTVDCGSGGGSANLGTTSTGTAPQIAGDPTSGFYTPSAGVVAVAISGSELASWAAGGEHVLANGSASHAPLFMTGTILTGGTGTTNFPNLFLQPTGASAATAWSTSGTGLGMNLGAAFAGNFLDFHVNGGASVFSVNSAGNASLHNLTVNNTCTGCITLTTTGSSGPAVYSAGSLNIPQYGGGLPATTTAGQALISTITSGLATWQAPVPITGDLSVTSTGGATVTGIQGVSVSAPTGTGAVVLASGFSANGTLTSGSVLIDVIDQGYVVSTSTLTRTSSTAFTLVPGLSINLSASGIYVCNAHLTGTADAAGGIKVEMLASNSLTATSASFSAINYNGTSINANTTVTSLASGMGAATAVYTDIYINGTIIVNVAGTLNVYAAQNVSDVTSTTVLLNSNFSCKRSS